ncbi:MAG: hypothetical protein EBQ66_04350, partial [Flavobacteriia bacterium]|nr:hypothetical protein [Flavobacteriia bacterium]
TGQSKLVFITLSNTIIADDPSLIIYYRFDTSDIYNAGNTLSGNIYNVQYGTFNLPALSANTSTTLTTGTSSLTGWTVTTGTGTPYLLNGTGGTGGTTTNITSNPTGSIRQIVALNQNSSISQTVNLIPAQYNLSMAFIGGSTGASNINISVINGVNVAINQNWIVTSGGFGGQTNSPFIYFYVSVAGTYTITITAISNSSYYTGIDNVNIFMVTMLANMATGYPVYDASLLGTNWAITRNSANYKWGDGGLNITNSVNSANSYSMVAINKIFQLTNNGFTASLWFKLPATGGTIYQRIFQFVPGFSANNGSIMMNYNDNGLYNQLNITIVSLDGTSYNSYAWPTILVTNTWYHAVWTLTSSGAVNLYINNSNVYNNSSWTNNYPLSSTIFNCNAIGMSPGYDGPVLGGSGPGGFGYPNNIFIDDFRFYNRVLSSNDVNILYTKPTTPRNSFNSNNNYQLYPNQIFTPSSISGCLLWFDAQDPFNNLSIPSNGSTITTWYDKSGANRNAVASTGITYNISGLNSKPALTFANTQSLFGSVPITGNTMTIFAICALSSSSQLAGRIISLASPNTDDWSNNSYMNFGRDTQKSILPTRNNIVTYLQTAPPNYSTPYLFECWYDGSYQYATAQLGASTAITSSATSGNFNISAFSIGTDIKSQYNGWFGGFMSEIIVYNTCLTTDQRQQVEGYLSWKWGLQSNLPTTHPYYNNPPISYFLNNNYTYQILPNINGI